MKKTEAISILATSVRPREPKDRARYDEAVKMAIEALKCSETPKSSEQNAETAQADHIADTGEKVEQTAEIAQNVQSVDDALTLLDSIHSGGRMMYSDYCALHDAISSISVQTVIDDTVSRKAAIDALKEAFNPSITNFVNAKIAIDKLPSAQPEVLACGEGELSAEPEPHEGHWIGSDGSYICSECNCSPMDFIDTMGASFDAYVETPMNYCPNCGTRMKGDTSEAD